MELHAKEIKARQLKFRNDFAHALRMVFYFYLVWPKDVKFLLIIFTKRRDFFIASKG